jgi:hypothetical protein
MENRILRGVTNDSADLVEVSRDGIEMDLEHVDYPVKHTSRASHVSGSDGFVTISRAANRITWGSDKLQR